MKLRNSLYNCCFAEKYFTEKHEWIDVPDGTEEGTVGITDYAQVRTCITVLF